MAQAESERKRKLFERLLARDDFTCKLCGLAVDNTLPRHHPMAPTIDHILPKSKGGTDAQYNLQIAHQKCNNDRGNTPIQEDSNVTRQLIAELSSLRRDFERLDRELRNLRKATPEVRELGAVHVRPNFVIEQEGGPDCSWEPGDDFGRFSALEGHCPPL